MFYKYVDEKGKTILLGSGSAAFIVPPGTTEDQRIELTKEEYEAAGKAMTASDTKPRDLEAEIDSLKQQLANLTKDKLHTGTVTPIGSDA